VKYVNGEDVYEKLLFRKAAAHYHLLELTLAENVLWELLKINPENQTASYLLKRCILRSEPSYLRSTKAISIFLFLLSAIVIGIELLVVRPFFDQYAQQVELVRISIFIFALALLVLSDGWHRVASFHSVNREIIRLKSRKKPS
jgi:hypothetical protein